MNGFSETKMKFEKKNDAMPPNKQAAQTLSFNPQIVLRTNKKANKIHSTKRLRMITNPQKGKSTLVCLQFDKLQ